MDADLVEPEQAVEKAHVPVRRAPRPDMAQDLRVLAGQVFRADRGHGAGAHIGQVAAVDDRFRDPIMRVHQKEESHLRRQAVAIVVDVVADDLHACEAERSLESAAEHVEMTVDLRVRHEVHARLDDGLLPALGGKAGLDRVQDLVVGQRQGRDVERVQVSQIERPHPALPWTRR